MFVSKVTDSIGALYARGMGKESQLETPESILIVTQSMCVGCVEVEILC